MALSASSFRLERELQAEPLEGLKKTKHTRRRRISHAGRSHHACEKGCRQEGRPQGRSGGSKWRLKGASSGHSA
eukprot:422951-Hanusia_phi.AAC.1